MRVSPVLRRSLRTSGPRRGRRGFSLLESMVAAGVLGIGLIGLVRLHTSTLHGMRASRDLSSAADIAGQLAEFIAAQPVSGPLSTCAPQGADEGCRQGTSGLARGFSPTIRHSANGEPCTWWFEGSAMQDGNKQMPPFATDPVTAAQKGYTYRVDEVVISAANGGSNGDTTLDLSNHPNGSIVQVYVCWIDDQGLVRQVMTSRFVTPAAS